MSLPHFIGIGVPKAATTWLYECLKEHPEICMSSDKEVDFFLEENFKKGLGWYEERFAHCNEASILGEYSPNYIYEEKAPERIKELIPGAKFIVILRNPIDRFFSAVSFEYEMGRFGDDKFEALLEKNHSRNLERGLYGKELSRWFDHFPKEQFHIILHDEISKDPKKVIAELYNFLEIDGAFIPPSTESKFNVTVRSNAPLKKMKKAYYKSYKLFSSVPLLVSFLKFLHIPQLVKWGITLLSPDNTVAQKKTREIPQQKRNEIKEYYLEDIEKLEELISRDLSVWK